MSVRLAWPAVLLVVCAVVALDFVRFPFVAAPEGEASGAARDLVVLLPSAEAPSSTPATVRRLATELRRDGATATVQAVGGPSGELLEGVAQERGGARVVAVSASTIAELQRAVRQPATGEGPAARRALRALATLEPVGAVTTEHTATLVHDADRLSTVAGLRTALRRAPTARTFGIPGDAASKMRLAALVDALGIAGEVPYRVFGNGEEASAALAAGDVDVVLAPRSQTLSETRRGEVRKLAGDGERLERELAGSSMAARAAGAPSTLVLLASGRITPVQSAVLHRRLRRASGSPRMAAWLRAHGLTRIDRPPRTVARDQLRTVGRLAAAAARVPQRHAGGAAAP